MTNNKSKTAKGANLIAHLEAVGLHAIGSSCPKCTRSVARVALVKLVYAFAVCGCDKFSYSHLVEQVWHRKCFVSHEQQHS